jgi:DNA-binding GntR family transcriptional regulator
MDNREAGRPDLLFRHATRVPSNVTYVAGVLREAIASGRIPFGVRLKETPIAKQLGVSRGPIRDALRVLAEDGLVELLPNKGALVPSPHASDMLEIYALRSVLGHVALRKLLGRSEEADLSAASAQLEALSAAAEAQDEPAALIADLTLQDELVRASAMKQTATMFQRLTFQVRMVIASLGIRYNDKLALMVSGDRELFSAVVGGRADEAERLWQAQREYWVRDFIRHLPGEDFDESLWIALTQWVV